MLIENLPKIQGSYRQDVNLAKTSWFQVGGKADILFKPKNTADLSHFIKEKTKNTKIEILGLASNVIIRDNGISGVLIRLGRDFSHVKIHDDIVEMGCSLTNYNATQFLKDSLLSGLEFLSGIPGNIGGAIAMNAGCFGSEVADFLIQVEAVNKENGNIVKISNNELNLSYRSNRFTPEFIFTRAWFKLYKEKNTEIIQERLNSIAKKRKLTQPIKEKTGGSTFKNPDNYQAWQLIDKSGLRGYTYGGAQVSDKHCNFLINTGSANAYELEFLGDFIIKTVYQKHQIKLEWEIKRLGRK